MKITIWVLFFFLVSFLCFGQMELSSSFQNKELEDFRFQMIPISNQFGNSLIVHSEGALHLMLLDENFQLLTKKKTGFKLPLKEIFPSIYFQTQEKVFGVYPRKRGKAPRIISINKEDFKIREEIAAISKSDKAVCSFEQGGFLYIVTREKGTKDISIYKFLEFELVNKVTFKGTGKHPLTELNKDYVSSLENEQVFFTNNSKKIFLQNEVLYFVRSGYNKPWISTRIFGLNFKTGETISKVFNFDHDTNTVLENESLFVESKRISVHILDNKLFQCARVKKDYYLIVYDLSTGALLSNKALGKIIGGEKNNEVKISFAEPTFTGLFMNSEKSDFQKFLDWNAGGLSKATTGIGIRKLGNGDLVVIFGKNKKLQNGGSYSPGIPGNDYFSGTPGTFHGGGSAGYRTHFAYFLMDKDGEVLPKEGTVTGQFEMYKKHLESVRIESKKKARHLEKRVFQSADGFHLITYNPFKKTFEVF